MVQRPPSHPTTRVLRVLLFTALFGWLLFLIALLADQPEPGAPSRTELAAAVEAALNARDAGALEPLLGEPVSGDAPAIARYLADQAAAPHQGAWRVTDDGTALVVSDDRGPRGKFAVVESDGRFRCSPVVALG